MTEKVSWERLIAGVSRWWAGFSGLGSERLQVKSARKEDIGEIKPLVHDWRSFLKTGRQPQSLLADRLAHLKSRQWWQSK
jgi:hypothetical protein